MADIEALARAGHDAFNARDEATARSIMSDDITMRGPGMPETRGIDAAVGFDKVWWDACSDANSELTHQARVGDTIIQLGIFRGTHDGILRTPMGEIPPTGRKLEGAYRWIFRFEGDKVVDAEILFDRLAIMEQLGLMPEPATV